MTKELITIAVSSILATIGSVVAVLLVDYIKHKFVKSKQEFNKLKRKINSVLIMYANRISNPIRYDKLTQDNVEYYNEAQKALREVATELNVFIDEYGVKTIHGVTNEHLHKVLGNLFYLSNAIFITNDEVGLIRPTDNNKKAEEIKELLKITDRNDT